MSKVYDSWERLVAAILNREHLRHLALCESFDTSISADFSSSFSFDDETFIAASRISSNSISRGANSVQAEYIEFEELKRATRNFRPYSVLGEGAFGHFSKGWIDENTLTASEPGLGTPVAVKMCSTEGLQGKEIKYLDRFRHPNIVKLIGYCYEGGMIMVYEFIPKGSLDRHLFRGSHDQTLAWVARIKVAVGAARALAFLHDNENPIVHRNFNTADILLDGEFNVQLNNFGLAMDGPTGSMTHVSTQVMGTFGYAAPEYIATGRLTTKCDVYGFGVVLVELLTGRKSIDKNRPINEYNLVDWATPYLRRKKNLSRIMDPKIEGQFPHKEAYTVATIALQCLSQMPEQRPRMAEVLVALEQL
ncbi:PREDICTED: protein kinase 2B, chloroplastic-like [Erythranthe guttata]|uniref:protein kinase 2B, chloroplastic-like n=1 Tax=Erythranthe guttata TaxID=4155 RepID=UPI00064DD801|nr:PREDICTED: protein kinase 2B, chloroplastic-like [Erythranthe guttata]|eukprot:XP_012856895.1 PREDICTED: protein kinase 2B, chloroplastic-like [Erythranthe guttata]